jgi:hypothetical protein
VPTLVAPIDLSVPLADQAVALGALCAELGLDCAALDELVHDAAVAASKLCDTDDAEEQERILAEASRHAIQVNGEGLPAQVVLLAEVWGHDPAARTLRALIVRR